MAQNAASDLAPEKAPRMKTPRMKVLRWRQNLDALGRNGSQRRNAQPMQVAFIIERPWIVEIAWQPQLGGEFDPLAINQKRKSGMILVRLIFVLFGFHALSVACKKGGAQPEWFDECCIIELDLFGLQIKAFAWLPPGEHSAVVGHMADDLNGVIVKKLRRREDNCRRRHPKSGEGSSTGERGEASCVSQSIITNRSRG